MNAKGVKEAPYDDESRKSDLEEFKNHLEEVTHEVQDPRTPDNQKYNLFFLLAIIFCAVVGGANSINAIHRYVSSKKKMVNDAAGLEGWYAFVRYLVMVTRLQLKKNLCHFSSNID